METLYHTASPVSFANEDVENKILIPAINEQWLISIFCFVLGPQAYEGILKNLTSTSYFLAGAINAKTREKFDANLAFNLVTDIRDVARAHIFAPEKEKTNGKRLPVSNDTFSFDTILTFFE
ncbi:uncharacterized protein KQ657_000608 [Scheffersomyces spartinae]|uniref:Uncharacterized protein n=1 Tax=Scheffersomyces spartinae TaxID=45513 RepID=A0A9P7V978_9ASCO|nr:uncharacterized protein KQ657_000608 [Scheffersomyces spartinae]KAG7193539.1 hypothetical protein KQ657_000608 [Scheffersomyces spartinae]